MLKKLFRNLTLGVVVFAVAVLVGYLTYLLAYRYQTQKLREMMAQDDFVSAATVSQSANSRLEGEGVGIEYYLARCENDDIAIYTVAEGKESFLYYLHVYTGNFPATELLRLREGVVLKTRRELAAFEEDYTS